MTKQEKVFDIINKFEFFQGQRAGRELWSNKPKEVQDKDIADFIKDINYIRSYLQDSLVLSREEYEILKVKEKEKHWFQTCMSVWENGKIDGSKETAEKILQMFEVWEDKPYVSKEDFKRSIADIFGIEIKE